MSISTNSSEKDRWTGSTIGANLSCHLIATRFLALLLIMVCSSVESIIDDIGGGVAGWWGNGNHRGINAVKPTTYLR